jgi:hypothetical protein
MKLTQNCLKAGLLLGALTLLSSAHSATAENQVPFKGVEVGELSPVSFDFPIATIRYTGAGNATHLGRYTVTGIFLVNVLSATETGTLTITAANGDMLFTTTTGQALQPPSLKEAIDNLTITGGTGRFEGATGSWVIDSHFAFVFGGPELSNPYFAETKGTISSPGSK